jgi:hypothetical protein
MLMVIDNRLRHRAPARDPHNSQATICLYVPHTIESESENRVSGWVE